MWKLPAAERWRNLSKQGYRVGIVDLTDGEPTPNSPGPEARMAEADAAAKKLGVHVRLQLGLTNRRLFDSFEARVALGKVFRAVSAEAGVRIRRENAAGFARSLSGDANYRCRRVLLPADEVGPTLRWPAGPHRQRLFVLHAGIHFVRRSAGGGQPSWSTFPTRWKPSSKRSAVMKRNSAPSRRNKLKQRVRAFAIQLGTAAGFPAGEMFSSPRLIGTRDLMHFLFGQKPGDQPAPPEPPR